MPSREDGSYLPELKQSVAAALLCGAAAGKRADQAERFRRAKLSALQEIPGTPASQKFCPCLSRLSSSREKQPRNGDPYRRQPASVQLQSPPSVQFAISRPWWRASILASECENCISSQATMGAERAERTSFPWVAKFRPPSSSSGIPIIHPCAILVVAVNDPLFFVQSLERGPGSKQ